MEKRYALQDFVGILANSSKQSKRKSEMYLRAFFDIVQKGLDEDQFVKVRGFGTFKLAQVSERESVNVATGERYTLGSHTRIAFQPDTKLKDLVNRPFAHFTTVTLEETTDFSTFEATDADKAEQTPAQEKRPAEQPTGSEKKTSEGGENLLESGNEAPESEENRTIGTAETIETPEEKKDIPRSEPETPSEETVTPNEETVTPSEEVIIPILDTETPHPETGTPKSKAEALLESAEVEDNFTLPQHPEASILHEEEDRAEYEEEYRENGRAKWVKTTLHVGLLLLLALSSYFVGYYHLFCPDCKGRTPHSQQPTPVQCTTSVPEAEPTAPSEPAKPQETEPVAEKQPTEQPSAENIANKPTENAEQVRTNTAETSAWADEAAAKAYEQLPDGQYLIVGTEGTHTVAAGEGIYSIARRHYGRNEFAAYIIVHNKIENPEIIAAGSQLKLPKLKRIFP